MVNEKEMVLDGFKFSSKKEFERAMKEKETIEYIVANTNMSDMKAVLKVYNKAIDKKSFQTVIGLEFVNNMRKRLIASGTVMEKNLAYVPVASKNAVIHKVPAMSKDEAVRNAEKYKKAYEAAITGKKIKNMAIAFLIVLLAALVIITVKSKYSPAVNLTFPVVSVVGKAPVILIVLVLSVYSIVIAPVVIVFSF